MHTLILGSVIDGHVTSRCGEGIVLAPCIRAVVLFLGPLGA